MGSKRERQSDRALADYHRARLRELVEHVAESVELFRAGKHDAFAVDETLHHYQRAARELWKFCWLAGGGAGVERTARAPRNMATNGDSVDWWQLGAPNDRAAQRALSDAGSPLAPDTRFEQLRSS